MLKNEREQEIIDIMKNSNGFATVKDLCERLFTSESSIRRDLTALSNKGLVKRTYGGAELITNFSNISAFSIRSHYNPQPLQFLAIEPYLEHLAYPAILLLHPLYAY